MNNIVVADLASGLLTAVDFLASLENPANTFLITLGCVFLIKFFISLLQPTRADNDISLKMTVDRVDDSPIVEYNNLTQKIKQKSKKIVMDAEKGEAKMAIDKCKKFLSAVQSSNFQCKIFINSWEV